MMQLQERVICAWGKENNGKVGVLYLECVGVVRLFEGRGGEREWWKGERMETWETFDLRLGRAPVPSLQHGTPLPFPSTLH